MNSTLLGGLSPATFLRRHWQKQPLLIKGAIPDFRNLMSLKQLIRLARHEACETRLVIGTGERQHVLYGPLAPAIFRDLPPRDWTVLVQGINHVLPSARALLQHFAFLPQARLDDIMVSYAAPGGGVGPHFDSYDVFLLQGSGRRRWEVSAQRDLELLPNKDLKILRRFRPAGSSVLGNGDMLYLPPRFSHNGVAVDACFTYSIGLRAPTNDEFKTRFLAHLDDELRLEGSYRDPDLLPCRHFGEIGTRMVDRVAETLQRIRWTRSDVVLFLGRYLTEPKPHIVLRRPPAIGYKSFVRAALSDGVEVHPALPLLFHGSLAFINGEAVGMKPAESVLIKELADRRRLPGPALRRNDAALRIFHSWYGDGCISIGDWRKW